MNNELIKLCFSSINEVFGGDKIDKDSLIQKYPELNKHQACFVTLKKNGNLRGCIGSIIATKPLIDDLIDNAKSSAFRDSRFDILKKQEINEIEIELSILTPPILCPYDNVEDLRNKIKIGTHGVILKLGNYQSTFLPSVWEQLPSFDIFFSHLCQKAGCKEDCLSSNPDIYTYEANIIK